jgi:hypothetical protein
MPKRKLCLNPMPMCITKGNADDFGDIEDPSGEFNRLRTDCFPKWSAIDNRNKIALFMHELNPHKVYTREEFYEYCGEKSITDPGKLFNIERGGKGYGSIIRVNRDATYQLYPELVDAFVQNFNAV